MPIIFNAIKHHLGFIRTFVEHTDNKNLSTDLLKIGGSQMDLYIGDLTTEQIFAETTAFLHKNDWYAVDKYKEQLKNNGHYIECILSDDSTWTLRLGIDDVQYIHIHPSRYARHTLRVKAGVLKTAIAFLARQETDVSTGTVNVVRKDLDLSPVKSLEGFTGFQTVLDLISFQKRAPSV